MPSFTYSAWRREAENEGGSAAEAAPIHTHSHLFPLKHVLVKVLLQLLIGQVDAQLLQVVELKRLKAINVEQSDAQRRRPLLHLITATG